MQNLHFDKLVKWQPAIIVIVSLLLYLNTLPLQYALDDSIVITENTLVQQGIKGIPDIFTNDTFYGFFGENKNLVAGGRYRPLSLVTFALEYEIFGFNPFISHLINVLLFALTCLLVFKLLELLFNQNSSPATFFSISFLTALVFATHPVHTEVVANIKGRDEIMGMLGAIASTLFFVKYLDSSKIKFAIYAVICYSLALLSKENAITFLAVIPLSIYFFKSEYFRKSLPAMIPFILIAALYLAIRQQFTGSSFTASESILNNSYIHASISEQFATIIYTIWEYFRILIFPHPLSHDYYFNQIPLKNWGNPIVIITSVFLLAGSYFSLKKWQTQGPLVFAFLYFFITFSIVSNVFFNVGTTMSERFIFMPSLGFALATALILLKIKNHYSLTEKSFAVITGILLLGYSIKTIERNPAWKDNMTLFSTDIQYSPNSAKLNNALGGTLIDEAENTENLTYKNTLLSDAIKYLTKAVSIYPEYGLAWNLLGNAYFLKGDDLTKAEECYKRAIGIAPGNADVNFNLGMLLNKNKQYQESLIYLKTATQARPSKYESWFYMGENYFHLNDAPNALKAFETALSINPENDQTYYKIGLVYGRLNNNLPLAIEYFNKAISLNANNELYFEDIGVAFGMMGKHEQALANFEKGITLKPDYSRLYFNMAASYSALGNQEKAQYYFTLGDKYKK
jgi:protein O-mannosyl-transferase